MELLQLPEKGAIYRDVNSDHIYFVKKEGTYSMCLLVQRTNEKALVLQRETSSLPEVIELEFDTSDKGIAIVMFLIQETLGFYNDLLTKIVSRFTYDYSGKVEEIYVYNNSPIVDKNIHFVGAFLKRAGDKTEKLRENFVGQCGELKALYSYMYEDDTSRDSVMTIKITNLWTKSFAIALLSGRSNVKVTIERSRGGERITVGYLKDNNMFFASLINMGEKDEVMKGVQKYLDENLLNLKIDLFNKSIK